LGRDLQSRGGLLCAQAAEKAKLDYSGFARIELSERVEGFVERHQIPASIVRQIGDLVQIHLWDVVAALFSPRAQTRGIFPFPCAT
jgi:hypothetical protein